jgi:hypothetical protein
MNTLSPAKPAPFFDWLAKFTVGTDSASALVEMSSAHNSVHNGGGFNPVTKAFQVAQIVTSCSVSPSLYELRGLLTALARFTEF